MDKERVELVQQLASRIDAALGAIYDEPVAFVLLSGPETTSHADVVGNVGGADMVHWLRTVADKIEANEEV